jgi:hypothetical protein
LESGCAIHPVDQPDPIEALDVIQRGGEGVGHDDLPLRTLGIDGLNGRARGLDEWRLNAANHLKADRDFVLPATIHRVIIDICSQQSRAHYMLLTLARR